MSRILHLWVWVQSTRRQAKTLPWSAKACVLTLRNIVLTVTVLSFMTLRGPYPNLTDWGSIVLGIVDRQSTSLKQRKTSSTLWVLKVSVRCSRGYSTGGNTHPQSCRTQNCLKFLQGMEGWHSACVLCLVDLIPYGKSCRNDLFRLLVWDHEWAAAGN